MNVICRKLVVLLFFATLLPFSDRQMLFAQETAALKPSTHEYQAYSLTVPTMGVRFRVIVYCQSPKVAKQASLLIRNTLAELENTFTDYDDQSEAMRLSHLPVGSRFPASETMLDLLDKSRLIKNRTNGYFDITIGKLTQIWRQQKRAADPEQQIELEQQFLKAATHFLARQKQVPFALDLEQQVFHQGSVEYSMDFGGIAKGYAADTLITRLADQLSINHVLVDASGDITATETPRNIDKEGSYPTDWLIGLSQIDPKQGLQQRIRIKNYSVASSGDARQFLENQETRKSHLLNPRTGKFVLGNHLTIVVNPKGYIADALASALSVCPADEFQTIIDRFPGTHATRYDEKAGVRQQLKSNGWDAWISDRRISDRSDK